VRARPVGKGEPALHVGKRERTQKFPVFVKQSRKKKKKGTVSNVTQ